jgi:hypothetical protein
MFSENHPTVSSSKSVGITTVSKAWRGMAGQGNFGFRTTINGQRGEPKPNILW